MISIKLITKYQTVNKKFKKETLQKLKYFDNNWKNNNDSYTINLPEDTDIGAFMNLVKELEDDKHYPCKPLDIIKNIILKNYFGTSSFTDRCRLLRLDLSKELLNIYKRNIYPMDGLDKEILIKNGEKNIVNEDANYLLITDHINLDIYYVHNKSYIERSHHHVKEGNGIIKFNNKKIFSVNDYCNTLHIYSANNLNGTKIVNEEICSKYHIINPNMNHIAVRYDDGIAIYNIKDNGWATKINMDTYCTHFKYSPDGKILIIHKYDIQSIKVYNATDYKLIKESPINLKVKEVDEIFFPDSKGVLLYSNHTMMILNLYNQEDPVKIRDTSRILCQDRFEMVKKNIYFNSNGEYICFVHQSYYSVRVYIHNFKDFINAGISNEYTDPELDREVTIDNFHRRTARMISLPGDPNIMIIYGSDMYEIDIEKSIATKINIKEYRSNIKEKYYELAFLEC